MKEILCKVYGDVQGVLFRQFAKEKALEYSVTGYAKNLEDETVEVVAQGEEENLKKFLGAISIGPEDAQVDSINISWGPLPEERFSQFDVL